MKLDFQTLYCLYVLEQKTTIEIAAMAGVSSPQTISNWLRKYAICKTTYRAKEPTAWGNIE